MTGTDLLPPIEDYSNSPIVDREDLNRHFFLIKKLLRDDLIMDGV
jgi:hypothetical protein